MLKYFSYLSIFVLIIFSSLSCNGGRSIKSTEATPRQLIIKFKTDVAETKVLSKIQPDFKDEVLYIRPMSGNAHVVRIKRPLDQKTLEEILQYLNKQQDIEYAEEDLRMGIQ